jgi:hypothetical protein
MVVRHDEFDRKDSNRTTVFVKNDNIAFFITGGIDATYFLFKRDGPIQLFANAVFQDGFDLSVEEVHFKRTTSALVQINGESLADNIKKVHISKER